MNLESIEIPTYEVARLLKVPDLDISLAWCDIVCLGSLPGHLVLRRFPMVSGNMKLHGYTLYL